MPFGAPRRHYRVGRRDGINHSKLDLGHISRPCWYPTRKGLAEGSDLGTAMRRFGQSKAEKGFTSSSRNGPAVALKVV